MGRGRRAKGRKAESAASATQGIKAPHPARIASDILNQHTQAKFVLFAISRADLVDKGPVMRGFIEVKTDENAAPVKVNVAAWLKIGRTSGTEYLSLKVGNNNPDDPEEYSVGPFYGRLFRQVEGTRTRYSDSSKMRRRPGRMRTGRGCMRRTGKFASPRSLP